MESIQRSGYFLPNEYGLILYRVFEGLIGEDVFKELLSASGKSGVDCYPSSNLNREFDFSKVSQLLKLLKDKYGERGCRGLSLKAGKATFDKFRKRFVSILDINDIIDDEFSSSGKLWQGVGKISKFIVETSDLIITPSLEEDKTVITSYRCPIAMGRREDHPICYLTLGFLQGTVNWLTGSEMYRVHESKCVAMGDKVCEFKVIKQSDTS